MRAAEQERPGGSAEDGNLLHGKVLSDRYRLGRTIGTGGASTVVEARDLLLGRDVALKVFRQTAATEEEVRVQQAEAQLVARLSHHALVTLLDAGVATHPSGAPLIYLVMERAAGTDLKRRLRAGPLPVKQVAYLGFDLAEGLHHVHEHGYLHRDIKPANVLLDERTPDRLRGKLTDFGISSIIGDDQGEFTTGTAAYLGPEQVEGRDATPATDVYSLGLVLLEALTGRVEYPGSVLQSATERLDRAPVLPRSVPEDVASVLRGMLARRPQDRPALPEVAIGFQNALIAELVRERALDPALLAPHEAERSAAAHRFDVLGDAPDDAFDRVVGLAARLLGAPVAFVSLVEADRKIVRSAVGLPGDEREVARNEALCAIPVASGRPVAVADVRADPRVANNPLLAGSGLRSYAAAPLLTHDGLAVGALAVLDRRPRDFDAAQLRDLAELAAIIVRELELRLAARRVVLEPLRGGGARVRKSGSLRRVHLRDGSARQGREARGRARARRRHVRVVRMRVRRVDAADDGARHPAGQGRPVLAGERGRRLPPLQRRARPPRSGRVAGRVRAARLGAGRAAAGAGAHRPRCGDRAARRPAQGAPAAAEPAAPAAQARRLTRLSPPPRPGR